MNRPLITIVTPVYNSERWLPELFSSLKNQSFQYWEHVIVDDYSTDNSREIIAAAAKLEPRIKPVFLSRNLGPAKARNIAISKSRGDYIAFLDADDEWYSKKLEIQYNWMIDNKIQFAYHDYRHMNEEGSKQGSVVMAPDKLDWKLLHKRRGYGSLTIMLKRSLCSSNMFPENMGAVIAEDFLAWSNILKKGVVAYRFPMCLARYRIMPSSRSSNKFKAAYSVWIIYRDLEKITFLTSLWYWINYAAHSFFIHRNANPKSKINRG